MQDSLDIHLHIHAEPSDRVIERLDQLLHTVSALAAQEHHMAADVQGIKQLVTDINDETNTVAAKVDAQAKAIQDLKDQIAQGTPVTQEDLDAIANGLTPISDRLKAIGADPSNPVPPTQ